MSSITYTNKPDRNAVFPSCGYCFCYLVSFEMLFFNLISKFILLLNHDETLSLNNTVSCGMKFLSLLRMVWLRMVTLWSPFVLENSFSRSNSIKVFVITSAYTFLWFLICISYWEKKFWMNKIWQYQFEFTDQWTTDATSELGRKVKLKSVQ